LEYKKGVLERVNNLKYFLLENILNFFFKKKLFLTPAHQNNIKILKIILNKNKFKFLQNAVSVVFPNTI